MLFYEYIIELLFVLYFMVCNDVFILAEKAVSLLLVNPICDKFFKDANGDSDLLVVPRRAHYDNRNVWKRVKEMLLFLCVPL